MIFKIGIIVAFVLSSYFSIQQQFILLGGYILIRDKNEVDLSGKLILDAFINRGLKQVAFSILFAVLVLVLLVINLF